MGTILVYFGVFLSTVIIANYLKKKERIRLKFKALLISIPSIIILSLRYGIGTDYFNYLRIYLYPNTVGVGEYEMMFQWLLDFSRKYLGNFQLFVFLTSFITVYIFMNWIVTYVDNMYWDISAFVGLCLYFGIWFAAIGQVIAMGVILYAIKEIENRKIIKFIILSVVAGLFHSSALIVLPCYFILSNKQDVSVSLQAQILRLLLVIFSCIVIVNLFYKYGQEIGFKYASYIDNYREGGRTGKFLMFSLLFYIPEAYLMYRTIRKYPYSRLYYYLLVIEATTFAMSYSVAYAFRMGQYLSIAHVVLAPLTISTCRNQRRKQMLLMYYILVFGFYFFYTSFALNYNGIVPYTTFFSI